MHPVGHAANRAGYAGSDQPCQDRSQQQRASRRRDDGLLRLIDRCRGLVTLLGAHGAELRIDLVDLVVDRSTCLLQFGLPRAQIAGDLDDLVQRRRVGGDRGLECCDQHLQFGVARSLDLCLGVCDGQPDVGQRLPGVVGITRRQSGPIAHHGDAQRVNNAGQAHRVDKPFRVIRPVGKGDLNAADIESRGRTLGVGFRGGSAQPVRRIRRRGERRTIGLQRRLDRADAFRNRWQLAELLVDLIGQFADDVDRLGCGILVADIPGPDKFLYRRVRTQKRGARLRHAGVSSGAGDQLIDRSTDPLDLDHGEDREQDQKAQDQREAAKHARTDADPGHHVR